MASAKGRRAEPAPDSGNKAQQGLDGADSAPEHAPAQGADGTSQQQIMTLLERMMDRQEQTDESVRMLVDRLNEVEERRDTLRDRDRSPDGDDRGMYGPETREEVEWEEEGVLSLNELPPLPGMKQRWIRTFTPEVGIDTRNIARQTRRHWTPRPKDTIPKGVIVPTVDYNGNEVIGVHGAVLMHRPVELHERHARYNRAQTDNLDAAMQNDLWRVHEPGKGLGRPRIGRRREVEVGTRAGGPVPMADDPDSL